MASSTNHYGLDQLVAGDDFTDNGYKFTNADRELIDRLLYLGAEGHHHSGADATVNDPTDPLAASVTESGGIIPAGTRVYYKYTWVDPNGFESAASPEAFVDTDQPVTEPAAATIGVATTGGTLLPGVYYYVLSAYTNVNTQETKAIAPTYFTVPIGSSTNTVTLHLPTLPAGADGFNVYVKKPGQVRYNWLAAVDMTVATPPTSYVDNGSVEEDCNRTIPTRNSTNGSNTVDLALPEAVPAGSTWKLYRTYVSGQYQSSLLHWVVEETFETSGVIIATYQDTGEPTVEGMPPSASQAIGSPEKVDLTDAAEVQGTLPMGRVEHPQIITFFWPGLVEAAEGTMVWVNEYPNLRIVGARATLAIDRSPNGQAVIVDVNRGTQEPTPSFSSIFANQAAQPKILVGEQQGDRATPVTALAELVEGDMLTVDIDQAGEGATPTDYDLTISIYAVAYGFDADNT